MEVSPSPRHILRNGGLADIDTELEELSMNAGSAPERIGEAHLPDQPPDFRRYAWPTGTPTRFPAPEGAKACPMPPDNGFRLYDREGIQNTRRDPIKAARIIRSKLLKTGRCGDARRSTFS